MPGLDLTIFEALPEALLVVRQEKIVWVNEAARRMLTPSSAPPDPLVGRSFETILAPGERYRLGLLEDQRRAGWDLPASCRIRFSRLDGAEITTDLRFGHSPEGMVLSARDVTDVTRAEELMGKLAALFARSSALPDADALLDAAEPVFDALAWKVGFTELVGEGSITRRMMAPAGDPVGDYGRSLIGIYAPLDKTPVLAEVARRGKPMFLDNLPTLLPGPTARATALGASMERAHVIRSAWCPIVTDGKLTHILAVTGRDLTEHDFVAVQLFAAQIGAALHMNRLRSVLVQHERLAAVGEMAAVMAHEVRNPLGVIFNALSGLEKLSHDGHGPELLHIIHEEAERLRRLVTDLLDFARPMAVELDAVPLRPLIEQAAEAASLDPSCAGADTRIQIEAPEERIVIETDARLFRHALVNLLVNALQYVPPKGRVALVVRVDGSTLHVRVENDGPTMSPEVAARVFEPFFTTRATGTGLGLAVVRRIVDDLGGRVDLEGSASGTVFALRLPLHERRASHASPPSG